MPGLLCVSVYVLLCFRLSYWLDKFQSASVCLGKSCAWSRGSPRRHMKTHSRAHKNTHTHTDQCLGSPIEIRSLSKGLYPGIPDITERQKICMKRETPYRALSVCVCSCAGVFVQTQHHGTLNGNQLLVSRALSHWSQLWRGSRLLPASHRAYKWIYYHSRLFIPTILLGMSLARLCNERVHSRVLF